MKRIFVLLFANLIFNYGWSQVNIVPQPTSLEVGNGSFYITKKTVIAARDEEDRKAANFLNDYLQQFYGFKLDVDKQEGKDYIRLNTKKFIKAPDKDAYNLVVNKEGITIEGDTYTGTFYGVQTLIQLLPVEGLNNSNNKNLKIPFVTVADQPRFDYRGMHLDVCRHFFPTSFLKKYIDYLALHKMNYFHWHLTDDQGWRIEIKKYPELISVAAYRNGTIIGRYPGTGNDNIRYGGYYTQEEVKDIVQYAADRHITVIPEIEMPGHASAAIAAFPYLSCFPNQKTNIPGPSSEKSKVATGKLVQETWGVFDDVFCAGNDSTFTFLEDVMNEVLPLFPSNLIHVGGDESPKTNWKKCPKCQARIKQEGLKDEHELQSYFIQRMEKYLNAKGKTLIGWDEILEGGLAPNAVVMSWRGEKGGIDAAKQKHKVIMTPGNYVYFDHTQSSSEDSVTIGGYTPIEVVYNYEPIPAELDSSEQKYVMGAQANLWTEYIAYPSKVEYMIFPRMAALSEVLWSSKENRNWKAFEKKLPLQFNRYKLWKANYSNAYYDIKATIIPTNNYKGIALKMEAKDPAGKLVYTTSQNKVQKQYTKPVTITQPTTVSGMYYRNNAMIDSIAFEIKFNKATGKKISLNQAPYKNYPGEGAFTLVDGVQNTKALSRGREFIGYNGGDFEATIDLGTAQSISKLILHTLNQEGSWIYRPSLVEVFVSNDNKTFRSVGTTTDFVNTIVNNGNMEVNFASTKARFIKVAVKNYGLIPDGKAGAGNRAWLFADEIEIF